MSTTYLHTQRIHDFGNEPYLFYYELDDERYATRKVEIFEDGKTVRASEKGLERDPTAPPDQPAPPLEQKANLLAQEITAREFEEAWSVLSGDR